MKHHIHSSNLVNGSMLSFIEVPDSSVVEAHIHFKAGFEHFGKDDHHIPHLLEHLLIGNGKLYNSEDKLLHTLQDLGATINASTDYEHVTVLLRAPYKNFVRALEVAFDCVFTAKFTEEAFEQEREIVLREIHEQFDGLSERAISHVMSKAFVGLVPEAWDEYLERTSAYTLTEIKSAYDEYISPKNMNVVIAGNISAKTRDVVKGMFDSLPVKHSPKPVIYETTSEDPEITPLHIDLDGSTAIAYVFVSPIRENESHKERVAFNFANQLLFDAPSAILPLKLRRHGAVYSVTTDVIVLSHWNVFIVNVMTETDKGPLAAVEILKYLNNYANGHIPRAEIESIKRYIEGMLSTTCETVSDLLEWYKRDAIKNRQFTDVQAEIDAVKSLNTDEITSAIKTLFTDAKLYGVVASNDAVTWTDDLNKMSDSLHKDMSENKIAELATKTIDEIESKRQAISVGSGFAWAAYWVLMFICWVTVFRVSNLPLKGSEDTISALNYATEYNLTWGLAFLIPFVAASLLSFVRGRRERIAEQFAITLNFIAAAVFIYGVAVYFGDFGVDNQPWTEDIASIVQPIFFAVAAPLAFIPMMVRLIAGKRAK